MAITLGNNLIPITKHNWARAVAKRREGWFESDIGQRINHNSNKLTIWDGHHSVYGDGKRGHAAADDDDATVAADDDDHDAEDDVDDNAAPVDDDTDADDDESVKR